MNNHPCPHFPACSGCTQSFGIPKPDIEQAFSFFHILQCPPTYFSGQCIHWRCRSKLAVTPQGIGLYKKNSHIVLPIPKCMVHHPAINQAVNIIDEELKQCDIPPYDELTRQGVVRYLQLTVERATKSVSVVFVIACSFSNPQLSSLRLLCTRLHQSYPLFHSFALNSNPNVGNTILTPQWEHIIGPQYTHETLCGMSFPFSYRHFMQANLEMYEQAAANLVSSIPKNATVLELYGGMGVLGLLATTNAKSVHISDITQDAYTSWQEAHHHLPLSRQELCTYSVGDAKQIFSAHTNADTLIVDPPRKGLALELLQQIQKSTITTVLYLSCSFESLKRDITLFKEYGYLLEQVAIYDFFPGTPHLEILVKLKKK